MLSIPVRNVQQAFCFGLSALKQFGVERNTRNGKALVCKHPFSTTYEKPTERVLFWPERDANPFFHLFEALWMLQGRRDVWFVAQFAKNLASYSDDGKTLHGAYGYRWHEHFGVEQLVLIIDRLRRNPEDRRCVLGMWDPAADLGRDGKDVPCNTHAYVQVNHEGKLELTVCNRSNDLVWGAYGANAVHFSVLQEYLATCIGVPVGPYHQVSANTHVYEQHWKLLDLPASREDFDPYRDGLVQPKPLMTLPSYEWHRELRELLDRQHWQPTDPFLRGTVEPMYRAWGVFRTTDEARVTHARDIVAQDVEASDWRKACVEWLERRIRD